MKYLNRDRFAEILLQSYIFEFLYNFNLKNLHGGGISFVFKLFTSSKF